MKPVHARLYARGDPRLQVWVCAVLVIGLAMGWSVARTVKASRALAAAAAQTASIHAQLQRAAAQAPAKEAPPDPLVLTARASLARDWNLHFAAVERVKSGRAQALEFNVNEKGPSVFAAYHVASWEDAILVTQQLNSSHPELAWIVEGLAASQTQSTLVGRWRSVGR